MAIRERTGGDWVLEANNTSGGDLANRSAPPIERNQVGVVGKSIDIIVCGV